MLLRELFESRVNLLENLSKGSNNVLANKNLVAGIANGLRSDVSQTMPFQLQQKFNKMADLDVAKWFLEQLDRIERQGYEGVSIGRDGQFNMWIAQSYANGNDQWEDIEGEMGPALRDFNILKNRQMLDPRHSDIGKYKGVKSLHRYMVTHYGQALEDIRKTAALAAFTKSARSIGIADEPEYKLIMIQNRASAIAFGRGATFCTANSTSPHNFNAYSARAPLFGLVVKGEQKPDTSGQLGGKTFQEKYQFDASVSSQSANFRDNLDHQVNPKIIREKFPYLWDDLSKGLLANRAEIETPAEEPGIQKLPYDVQRELQKLKDNLAPYWTDKKRPIPKPEEVSGASAALPPPAVPPQA
jgi:hypothetical protein